MEICEFRSGNHVSGGFGQSVVFHVVSLGLGFFLPRRQNCCVGVIIIMFGRRRRLAIGKGGGSGGGGSDADDEWTGVAP